jgi:acylphosphatase
MIRRSVYFSGRVQGVGFRFTTVQISEDFEVSGYVRNLPDGRVEAVFEGEPGEIDRFQAAVAAEMRSYIRDIQQQDSPASGEFAGFQVRH